MKHNSARDLIARAVIFQGDAVLVNRSRNKKTGENYCALPGGHVDPGESCVQALRRELQEELGCDSEIGALHFVTESVYAGRKTSEKKRHELVLYFYATFLQMPPVEGDKVLSPEANKNFTWLALRDLDSANLLPRETRERVLQIAGNKPVSPTYSFDDSTR